MDNGGNGGMNTGGVNFDVPSTPVEQQPITTVEPEISPIQEQVPDVETEKMPIEKASPEDLERTMSQTPEIPMAPGVPAEFNVPVVPKQEQSPVDPKLVNKQDNDWTHRLELAISVDGADPKKLLDDMQESRKEYLKETFGRVLGEDN